MSISVVKISSLISAASVMTGHTYLQIHYPEVDQKNHKSRDTLVHSLREAGFLEVADAIEQNVELLSFKHAEEAMRVFDYIEEHTAALSVTFYHGTLVGQSAVDRIRTI